MAGGRRLFTASRCSCFDLASSPALTPQFVRQGKQRPSVRTCTAPSRSVRSRCTPDALQPLRQFGTSPTEIIAILGSTHGGTLELWSSYHRDGQSVPETAMFPAGFRQARV